MKVESKNDGTQIIQLRLACEQTVVQTWSVPRLMATTIIYYPKWDSRRDFADNMVWYIVASCGADWMLYFLDKTTMLLIS